MEDESANQLFHDYPPPLDDASLKQYLACPPLKWGILGCGRVSNDFVQALKLVPSAKVVAVSARSPKSAQAFAQRHGVSSYCKSVKNIAVIIVSSLGFFSLLCCFYLPYIITI